MLTVKISLVQSKEANLLKSMKPVNYNHSYWSRLAQFCILLGDTTFMVLPIIFGAGMICVVPSAQWAMVHDVFRVGNLKGSYI